MNANDEDSRKNYVFILFTLRVKCFEVGPHGVKQCRQAPFSCIIAENWVFVHCSRHIHTTIFSEGSLERSRNYAHFEHNNCFLTLLRAEVDSTPYLGFLLVKSLFIAIFTIPFVRSEILLARIISNKIWSSFWVRGVGMGVGCLTQSRPKIGRF